MSGKINLAIFSARGSKTGSSANGIVLTLLGNLDPLAYRVSLVTVDSLLPPHLRQNPEVLMRDPSYVPFADIESHANLFHIYDLSNLTIANFRELFDIAIIALPNDFGEDGKLSGLLELSGLPFLSSETKTTALCFDKELTKRTLKGCGIPVPRGFEMHESGYDAREVGERLRQEFGYPAIIKPTSSGASRGITLVNDEGDLGEATENAFRFSPDCVVEEYIRGREFAVCIYGNYLHPEPLPIAEIFSDKDYVDYEAKYGKSKTRDVCPAAVDGLGVTLADTAVMAYKAVKAEGAVKVDLKAGDGQIFVLEINTLPSLLPVSIFPRALRAAGISLSSYLDSRIREKLRQT